MTRTRRLAALARLYGVDTSYIGMGGERRTASPESMTLALRALGARLDDEHDAADALRDRQLELDARGIQPVQVAWGGSLPSVRLRLAHGESDRAAVVIRLESGEVETRTCRAEPVRARARGGWTATHTVRIGGHVPLGYHRLQVETSGSTFESLIIAAPRSSWVPPDARDWGAFIPLHALCSERSWGTGDYRDLARAAEWVGSLGGSFLSTLPLLATFLDAPFEPSPYSPASRLFWNELFVDVTAVPGWRGIGVDVDELERCRRGDLVDYRRAASLKRRAMERALAAASADPSVRDAMDRFAASHAHASDYARFRAVCDRRREPWQQWPDRMRRGTLRSGDYAAEDYDYHLFAQWQADEQLGAIRSASDRRAAGLYLDMPLGVNPAGYDVWRFRELFADGVSAGAPPDVLFTGGQDWGFRPFLPDALRASGYAYFIETLRHHLRHAAMLRLDHVMALYRLYWVPFGLDAKHGVYVRYADDEMFAILVLESARHRAVVIGEDLGTVPPAVRRTMDRRHIHRMHVVQYEAVPDRDPPVPPPDENVVASLNTHDMPLFAGFWRGTDIADQFELGLIDEDGLKDALAERALLRERLSRSVGAGGEIEAGLARQRLLERLAASAARYVLVTLEDLWLEDRPQNVPGTADNRPNWRRRARRSLDEIMNDPAVRRMLHSIAERRRARIPE